MFVGRHPSPPSPRLPGPGFRNWRRVAACGALASLGVLAACRPGAAPTSRTTIVGGAPVADGDWPAVVGIARRQTSGAYQLECTGALIAPRLVVTAGHCLPGDDPEGAALPDALGDVLRVYRGDGVEGGLVAANVGVERGFYEPTLRAHPRGYADLGLLVLAAPLADVEPLPVVASLADERALTPLGQGVRLIGFGRRDDDGQGLKYAVDTAITAGNEQEIVAGGDGRDACVGDSGGPALARDAAGRWRLLGVVSRGRSLGCGAGGYVSLLADAACWAEHRAGVLLPSGLGTEGRCDGAVPLYDDATLDDATFLGLCSGPRTPTQAETVEALLLATGTTTCADADAALRAKTALDLDGLMIRDASPLAGFVRLESLSLRGDRLGDVRALTRLSRLRALYLEGNDVSPAALAVLAPLERAGLHVFGKRRQLSAYTSTDFLALCAAPATPPAILKTIKALQWQTQADTCPLANQRLLGIRSLKLDDRGLSDLAPLAGLEGLESLDLAQNPVRDLTPLAGLESLLRLDLTGTGVTDLAPLQALIARGLVVKGVSAAASASP